MAKIITIKDKDNIYKLEFNRESVKEIENNGFVITEVGKLPVTSILALFTGAFLKNHPEMAANEDEAIRIMIAQGETSGLLAALIEMYNETIESLMSSKNAKWVKNW